jgi:anti-sigma factor RsiW
MCDRSDQLIAWLDHELPPHEAADLERHVATCAECGNCLHAYGEVNKVINAYCDAATESAANREPLARWVPMLSVAATAVALLLLFSHQRAERHPPQTSVAVASASPNKATASTLTTANAGLKARAEKAPVPIPSKRATHRPHVVAPVGAQLQSANWATTPTQNANWMPAEPAIQIAIPADAMFAPGAVPQGVSFTAELSIAADGSAQQLRLRP